jgi:hypothetical protein
MPRIYRFLLLLCFSFGWFSGKSQQQFTTFLATDFLPECYSSIDSLSYQTLLAGKSLHRDWNEMYATYNRESDVLRLFTSNECSNIRSVYLKRFEHMGKDYILAFREKENMELTYGKLKLFVLEENEWQKGRKIEVSWQKLFHLSDEAVQRLTANGHTPDYMIRFERDFIFIDIPWKLYEMDEGSETHGYVMGGAKQPVKLPYHFLIR